ncbi:SET domain containing 5 [Homo sapiens]|uniref:SET domain containing 5 n=1 Tax=Homo sapiens TaxID=9606 RepID=F8WD12_HUMAN|nr:SET domain containing 5 [Homo sapiens]KAI4028121.1 SET domain containing 5 [Homo sapiens]
MSIAIPLGVTTSDTSYSDMAAGSEVSCLGSEWKRAWSLGQCRRHFDHLTHCKCHVRFHGSIKRSN